MYRVTGELNSENLYFKKFLKIVLLLDSVSEVKQSLGGSAFGWATAGETAFRCNFNTS
jgi:hypothetical protein